MIEYNFTELDSDYITLRSQFILNHDYSQIRKQITKLAELGQINAIQTWVMMKEKEETNPKIEKYVDEIYSKDVSHLSMNELIVVMNKELFQGNENVREILNELFNSYNNWIDARNAIDYDKRKVEDAVRDFEEIKEKLYRTKFGKCLQYFKGYESNSALSLQRQCEYLDAVYQEIWSRISKEGIKHIRKILLKKCTSRHGCTEKERPFVEYALAKNIEFFKDVVRTNLTLRKNAFKIFEKLSQRELSKTLTDYINNNAVENAEQIENQIDELVTRLKEISPNKDIEFSIKDREV